MARNAEDYKSRRKLISLDTSVKMTLNGIVWWKVENALLLPFSYFHYVQQVVRCEMF